MDRVYFLSLVLSFLGPWGAILVAGSAVIVQAASGQVIEGTVVNSVTGAPVDGASVQIESAGKAPYQGTSDAQGAFRIEGLADGTYTAIAFKNGFLTVQDQAARKPFRVVAGLDPVQLRLSLTPRGRLSGRVFDGNDHPVPGAGVWMFPGGGGIGQSATSDADGGFSFDLRPGSYLLSARAPLNLAAPAPVGDQHYAWAKTWFPGVPQMSAAQRIAIRPGAELLAQDIKLQAVNAYRIRGQIRDGDGDPVPQLAVTLVRSDDSQPLERTAVSAKDGSFEFADVYDGDWRLSAERAGDVIFRAVSPITIAGRDAEGLDLRLNAPFSLPVEFALETSDSTAKVAGSLLLKPDWGGPAPASSTDKTGNSKIESVYPGRYLVVSLPLAGRGYYLASVTLGDRDILGQLVEIDSGAVPLKISYRADGGAIRGTVEDCGAATIAIEHCTADNRFEIHNLRPGRYYAFAFDQFDTNRSEFLSTLPAIVNKAVSVEVRANETANVDLKVTVGTVP
jgi:hypothetical protein